MSAINSATTASGSQLVTNGILMSLGQVYGGAVFTSKHVSKRLGLGFLSLYISKLLSRMSRRPYYLLSVVTTVPRPGGGYENQYRISRRGWNKINYLRNHPPPATPANPRLGDEMWKANYLLNGKGTMAETMLSPVAQTVVQSLPNPSILDEVGMLLVTFDDERLPAEIVNRMLVRSKEDPFRLVERATYLQKIGLVPADISPTLLILQALRNGSSDAAILIILLLRGAIKLRDELISLKKSSPEISHKTSSPETKQASPETVITWSEVDDVAQTFLEGFHELKDTLLEVENDSLKRRIEKTSLDALQEKSQLSNRNYHLKSHILNMTKCLALVVEKLDEIKDPPPAVIAVKSFVSYALAGIVLMNNFAI
jgi:hypothetical protein